MNSTKSVLRTQRKTSFASFVEPSNQKEPPPTSSFRQKNISPRKWTNTTASMVVTNNKGATGASN